jgi:hypothetical protein
MVTITPLAGGKVAVRYQRDQAADTVLVPVDMPISEALRLLGVR